MSRARAVSMGPITKTCASSAVVKIVLVNTRTQCLRAFRRNWAICKVVFALRVRAIGVVDIIISFGSASIMKANR